MRSIRGDAMSPGKLQAGIFDAIDHFRTMPRPHAKIGTGIGWRDISVSVLRRCKSPGEHRVYEADVTNSPLLAFLHNLKPSSHHASLNLLFRPNLSNLKQLKFRKDRLLVIAAVLDSLQSIGYMYTFLEESLNLVQQ